MPRHRDIAKLGRSRSWSQTLSVDLPRPISVNSLTRRRSQDAPRTISWVKGSRHTDMASQVGNGGADCGPSEFEKRRAELVGQIGDVSVTQSRTLRSKLGRNAVNMPLQEGDGTYEGRS